MSLSCRTFCALAALAYLAIPLSARAQDYFFPQEVAHEPIEESIMPLAVEPLPLDEPASRVDLTTEPLGTEHLLQRLEELEQRDADHSALLKSLDSQWTKHKEQEQAKQDADAKKPTAKWTAQLQADTYWFDQDDASRATYGDIENGEAFRRARFGIFGDYGPTEYRVEMDFALAGRPSFLDVFAGIRDLPCLGRVRVGHFFEPFSLERLTPNRFVTFMERSLLDQAFVPARNIGVMANNTLLDNHATWSLGLFRTESDVFGDDVGDELESSVTGRFTLLPYYDEACEGRHYVHLGVGGSYRDPNAGVVRFRAQPESRIGAVTPNNIPFFVDTGNIPAVSYQLAGLEAAWVCGPFSLASEYVAANVDSVAAGDLRFDGWYVQASYFLTGEHRPYRREAGTFDRVMPHTEFVRYSREKEVEFGPGAWEIAARISHLDLNDLTAQGGRISDVSVGLNWYLNPYLRWTTNYIRAMPDHPTGGRSDTDIVATRIGYDF